MRNIIAALIQSRDKELGRALLFARKAIDFIGRLSALLALLFICYGFYIEGHRSKRTNEIAEQAKSTAASNQSLTREVARLTRENQHILRDVQDGRRRSIIETCERDRKEHAAMIKLLTRFHVAVPEALGPVDCKKRLDEANLGD